MEGFDYSFGYNSKVPGALKKAGASFVVRYVGTSSKCLTAGERDALHATGIGIGLVYEIGGTSFTGGAPAGTTDGAAARAACERLGVPSGAPIWFAIDTDTAQYDLVKAYLSGCAAACGLYEARLYAGAKVLDAVGGSGHWQTSAWSAGKVSAHAGIYQYAYGVTVGGVDCDRVRTLPGGPVVAGGWLTYGAPPPAAPKPPVVALSRDKLRVRGNSNPRAAVAVKFEKAEMAAGRASWKSTCAGLVRQAFGVPVGAWGAATRTAANAWHLVPSNEQHTWYSAPFGVPVFWTGGSTGAGHVAIADGQGNCWTSDFGPAGYIGDGRVRLVPIASIAAHDKLLTYAGWSETYLHASVYA